MLILQGDQTQRKLFPEGKQLKSYSKQIAEEEIVYSNMFITKVKGVKYDKINIIADSDDMSHKDKLDKNTTNLH